MNAIHFGDDPELFGIAHRVLDIAMLEPRLQRPRIVARIRQRRSNTGLKLSRETHQQFRVCACILWRSQGIRSCLHHL
jgi:hypothetical protein